MTRYTCIYKPLIVLLLFSIAFFAGCLSTESTEEQLYPGSWSVGWPNLKHDNMPYESDHFIVFSDGSNPDWRQRMADSAEAALQDILLIENVGYEDFTFLSGNRDKKIHILADYNQQAASGFAYRDGVIIRALDSPRYSPSNYQRAPWSMVLQHEITHVTEFLLIGDPKFQQANDVWLREGFANVGARNHRIQTTAELNDWKELMIDVEGSGNPIGIHRWSDFPQSVLDNQTTIEYYGFFELAARYLVDPNGNGTSIENLKDLYTDLGNGKRFDYALEDNFGITLRDFEDNYWTLMENYLKNPERSW